VKKKTPKTVEDIRSHGGLRAIHVTPLTSHGHTVGWQNVYVCKDGTKFLMSVEQENVLMKYDLNPIKKGD
jgi:hypothetical protein